MRPVNAAKTEPSLSIASALCSLILPPSEEKSFGGGGGDNIFFEILICI